MAPRGVTVPPPRGRPSNPQLQGEDARILILPVLFQTGRGNPKSRIILKCCKRPEELNNLHYMYVPVNLVSFYDYDTSPKETYTRGCLLDLFRRIFIPMPGILNYLS